MSGSAATAYKVLIVFDLKRPEFDTLALQDRLMVE